MTWISTEPVDLEEADVGFFQSQPETADVDRSQLREKLRKIEALFAGAGTAGEQLAAEAALERVRARLTNSVGRTRRLRCSS